MESVGGPLARPLLLPLLFSNRPRFLTRQSALPPACACRCERLRGAATAVPGSICPPPTPGPAPDTMHHRCRVGRASSGCRHGSTSTQMHTTHGTHRPSPDSRLRSCERELELDAVKATRGRQSRQRASANGTLRHAMAGPPAGTLWQQRARISQFARSRKRLQISLPLSSGQQPAMPKPTRPGLCQTSAPGLPPSRAASLPNPPSSSTHSGPDSSYPDIAHLCAWKSKRSERGSSEPPTDASSLRDFPRRFLFSSPGTSNKLPPCRLPPLEVARPSSASISAHRPAVSPRERLLAREAAHRVSRPY